MEKDMLALLKERKDNLYESMEPYSQKPGEYLTEEDRVIIYAKIEVLDELINEVGEYDD
jgi:hypothetical protein